MATDSVPITPGSGANVATYAISEDAKTKEIQRVVLNTSAGAEASLNPNGSAADSASTPVAFSTEGKAQFGSLTETAPGTDTASSGLNGRLQRIAQRLTALIGLLPSALGLQAPSASLSIVPAALTSFPVAASQTNHVLGATGATGDYLSHLIIQPVTTAAGSVTLFDNTTQEFLFTSGTLSDLKPIIVPLGAKSASGAWKITTGTNVTVTAFGQFT